MPDELLKVDSTKDNLIEQIRDLREKIDELERFALTSQDIVATSINCSGDIYTDEWTDYSSLSTIVGWSAYTQGVIEYKKIGKFVFVNFRIVGTSDTTGATFTLPHAEGQDGDPLNIILTYDNTTTWDNGYVSVTGNLATCTQDPAGGGFTASGTKGVYGQFWYEAA